LKITILFYFMAKLASKKHLRQEKSEDEIRIQKTYFERLFNSAPEAIVLHDNNDLIVDVNDEFTRLFGYTREEAIGKPINRLVASEEYLEEATDISERVIGGERIELETKRKRKDGSLIDVSILGAPIIHGGKQVGDFAIYRDISERKKSEEELRIQKTYFEKLFNSAPEAIVLHDNNDLVVDVNHEFTSLFGYSREEAIGKPINELVAPEEFRQESAMLSHQVINGQIVETDSQRKHKDGTIIDVSILGAPILYGKKQMGVYAIYRDITERKRAEEVRIRLQEEDRMARNIQKNLLPEANPRIPGYDIAGRNIPALNVGGDYYDFIPLDEHRLVLALGDVSGKGIAASMVMANLQATIRAQTIYDADPRICLEKANKLLYQSTDSKTFISLFFSVLNVHSNTITYANAGQDLPVLFSPSHKPVPLKTRGIALGMKDNVIFRKRKIPLNPGDRLLIYSDGITEAMNERMEEFGEERLVELVQHHSDLSAQELIKKIISTVNKHFGNSVRNDDMTLIVLIRKSRKK
jgi:PAS domain S-box-containing protein